MSNVIDIDELRFTRDKRIVRPREECAHRHMTLDEEGQFVKCDDCGVQLSPYWVLNRMLDGYDRALSKIAAREQRIATAQEEGVHLLAARRLERVWRSRTMVPACPHCGEGIGPKDDFGGTCINKALYERRRAAKRGGK